MPSYCLEEVSDQAMALLLACARKVVFFDRAIREESTLCSWDPPSIGSAEEPLESWALERSAARFTERHPDSVSR